MHGISGRYLEKVVGALDSSYIVMTAADEGEPWLEKVINLLKHTGRLNHVQQLEARFWTLINSYHYCFYASKIKSGKGVGLNSSSFIES